MKEGCNDGGRMESDSPGSVQVAAVGVSCVPIGCFISPGSTSPLIES